MKNEKHKVSSLVKRVCLVLSLLTPGSSMMVIASDEIAIVQQTGNITVTGTVVDQTGEPVIGVNVLVKGSTNGTITDIDGNSRLKASPPILSSQCPTLDIRQKPSTSMERKSSR